MEGSNPTVPDTVLSMLTALPSKVADDIRPAVEAVKDEARAGTRLGEHRRLLRELNYFVRRYTDPGYRAGIAVILATAFPGVVAAPDSSRRTCRCEECEDPECDGSCERCDEWYECSEHQCEEAQSCCGWCRDCDSHHGDYNDDVIMVPCHRNGEHRYCTECQHECDG